MNNNNNENNVFEVYCDGSCNTQKNIGAWASIIINKDKNFTISGKEINTTNNRMEILGALKAIEFIENQYNSINNIIIFTDSQYLCRLPLRRKEMIKNDFMTKTGKERKNIDLIKPLFSFLNTYNINFVKVKAHQKKNPNGANFNRYVDKLARKIVRLSTTIFVAIVKQIV
ncbi:MAG: ribonuclease H [Pseudomonadota bacterium]